MVSPVRNYFFLLSAVVLISDFTFAVEWDDLRVTFGFNIFKSFDRMPRTEKNAMAAGFLNISTINDCTNGGKFVGFRYVLPDDLGLALIYDKFGIVSGIQMNLLKSEILTNTNKYNFGNVTMYQNTRINGHEFYTLTAYFVPPGTICEPGRIGGLITNGTGTGLFFQNGPTPADIIKVSLDREQAINDGWTKNNCFPGMGYHNFYKSEEFGISECRDIRPVFLLFTKSGELLGFGFSGQGFSSSPRFEHPGKFAVKSIVGDDVAQCLLDVSEGLGVLIRTSTICRFLFGSLDRIFWAY